MCLGLWALWPGLAGDFIFDDASNLAVLGSFGRVDDFTTLVRYLTSGTADPTGRPLALASFLLDARNWPADPYPFKRTNLFLHLFNGLLLAAVLTQLSRLTGSARQAAARVGILAAALWWLHPLWTSTVLYVVQREAMLPATFALLAILGWMCGRRQLLQGDVWRGGSLLVGAIVGGTVLALSSKANGLLVPVLVLVIELTLLRAAAHDDVLLRRYRILLLIVPSIGVLSILLLGVPGAVDSAARMRPWTLGERLLTQPRVLFQYLEMLWIPRSFTSGLFNDDLVVSRSLFAPWTTFMAIAGMLAMVSMAWRLRRVFPAAAASTLFFFCGHLIESGPVALELYFEHRNYLPAMLLFWPVARWLVEGKSLGKLRISLTVALPLALAMMSHQSARLWGEGLSQSLVWAAKNPDSARASAWAAQWELSSGDAGAAERRLRRALQHHPDELQLALNYLGTRCQLKGLDDKDIAVAETALRRDPDPSRLGARWIVRSMDQVNRQPCAGLDSRSLDRLVAAFAANPKTATSNARRRDIANLRGRIALSKGQPQLALRHFDAGLRVASRPEVALAQAAQLASAGAYVEAIAHLDKAAALEPKQLHRWRSMQDLHEALLYRQNFWQQQIGELRAKIEADLARTRHQGA